MYLGSPKLISVIIKKLISIMTKMKGESVMNFPGK
jgi:hypothetical protein